MTPGRYRSPRRADAAAATRVAVLDAAWKLFTTVGYASTTVPQIARAADVAVPTIYTSAGGKAEILAALLKPVVDDPGVAETLAAATASKQADRVIQITGDGVRRMHERHWEAVTLLFPQSRSEPAAAEVYQSIVDAFQAALGVIADHLTGLGALRPGVDRDAALDSLWFFFGQAAWPTLVRDRGWSLEQAQQWLTARVVEQLLPAE